MSTLLHELVDTVPPVPELPLSCGCSDAKVFIDPAHSADRLPRSSEDSQRTAPLGLDDCALWYVVRDRDAMVSLAQHILQLKRVRRRGQDAHALTMECIARSDWRAEPS